MKTQGNKILCDYCEKVVVSGSGVFLTPEKAPYIDFKEEKDLVFCSNECVSNYVVAQYKEECLAGFQKPDRFIEVTTARPLYFIAEINRAHEKALENFIGSELKDIPEDFIELTEYLLPGISRCFKKLTAVGVFSYTFNLLTFLEVEGEPGTESFKVFYCTKIINFVK